MLLLILSLFALPKDTTTKVFTYTASPDHVRMYYYDEHGIGMGSVNQLNFQYPDVKFNMIGQPYDHNFHMTRSLYIENGDLIHKPGKAAPGASCVFALTKKKKAVIVPLEQANIKEYRYAVQVGLMLVSNGRIDPKLTKSNMIYQRVAYGILRDGRVLFMVTQDGVTYQQLAQLLIDRGCVTACYIDDGCSDCYWTPDHNECETMVGVMVGVTDNVDTIHPSTSFDFRLNTSVQERQVIHN